MKLAPVTVAIPAYNRPALLQQALESVAAQEFQEFEVFVSDDASSYDAAALVAAFGDRRIRFVRQAHNLGLVGNWRVALTTPTTRYIAFLNDDDWWLPHHLGEAVTTLDAHPEATFYSCATQMFGLQGDLCRPPWCDGEGVVSCHWQDTGYGVWLQGSPVIPSSVVVRREALDGLFLGGRSWPWCCDWLWWGQLALKGPFLFNGRVGASYRRHDANTIDTVMNSRGKAHWLFTVRELGRRAWAVGALRDLAGEMTNAPASALSSVVIALAAPESPRGLARQARQVFESRRDVAREPGCATNYRIAATVGGWWLRYADVSTRLLGRWWPAPWW
jgi:glycosyltransferase involved in cell wall biosynthesis